MNYTDMLTMLAQAQQGAGASGARGLMEGGFDPWKSYINLWESGFNKARPGVDEALDYLFRNSGGYIGSMLDKIYGR